MNTIKHILFIFFVFNLFSCSFHHLHSLKIHDNIKKEIEMGNISLHFKEWETQYMFFPIPLIFYTDNNNEILFKKPKYEEMKLWIKKEVLNKFDFIKINNIEFIIYDKNYEKIKEFNFLIDKIYNQNDNFKILYPNKYKKSKYNIKIVLNIIFKNNNFIQNFNYIYWYKYENYFCIFPYPIGGWGV